MQAIVMAGGMGTRLKPLTDRLPKPMVPIINKPLLEYSLLRLRENGFTDIALTLGYRGEIIEKYFGDGRRLGVCLTYFHERTPLGTAGGVKACESFVKGDFLVLSGDAFCDLNLEAFFMWHKSKGGLATLALKSVDDPRGFGVVETDSKGCVTSFVEKPDIVTKSTVNTGIYALKPDILRLIPNGFYDFGKQLFPRLTGKIYGVTMDGFWSDIGTLSSYYDTNKYVAESKLFGTYFSGSN